jgi:hypothetical protein
MPLWISAPRLGPEASLHERGNDRMNSFLEIS